MGAAIECFPGAGAVVVPRTRFAPVKTTSDLLALRSDAYVITEDGRAMLAPEREGIPPEIDLDSKHFKLVDQLEDRARRRRAVLAALPQAHGARSRCAFPPLTVSKATW